MNRNRRLAYLSHMGIESWLPTKPLAGAVAGHWIAAPINTSPTAAPAANAIDDIRSSIISPAPQKVIVNRGLAIAEVLQGQAGLAHAVVSNVVANDVAVNDGTGKNATANQGKNLASRGQVDLPNANNSPDIKPSTTASDKTFDRFTLASTVCGDILIVDDIGTMTFAGSVYQNWLNAILFALDKPLLSETNNLFDRFEWPLADSGLFDSSPQAAKDVVAAWLLRKLQENQVSWVLLMGSAAVATLSNVDAEVQLGSVAALPGRESVQALLTHGSQSLWSQPLLKREFWQHLQVLGELGDSA